MLQERNLDDHFDDNGDFGSSILDGFESVDISHAGGEFYELTREMMGNFWNVNTPRSSQVRRPDYRTRRDRTRCRTEAFDNQMPVLVHAYLDWHLTNSATNGQGFFSHRAAAAHQGTMDINAGSIAVKVVDMFYAEKVPLMILPTDLFLASALVHQGVIPCSPISPSTGITIESLDFYRIARQCNPHFSIQAYVQFHLYLSRQFSIALNVYLQILTNVDTLLHEAIGRQDPDWRLKHCCPACTYTLQDEVSLQFKILFTMDGNDSLKRVLKKVSHDSDADDLDNMESRATQHSSELPTTQYDNPCIGRWKNMQDDKTKKMWDVFDESGIFLAVCHMIQSGEQAKYPLAIVSKLLDVFGRDLGGSYDIGCRFKTTLHQSILGQRARKLNYTSLDLEGCERTFSKSNALASSVQYASTFHRRQTITHYFQHNDDFETFANLTTFLYNNYKQALDILHDGQKTLPKLMHELGVTDPSVFDSWLAEERTYLLSLNHEPERETLEMEYWQKLVNLSTSKIELNAASAAWAVSTLSTVQFGAHDIDLKMVQELKGKLNITRGWVPKDQEWKDAGCLVANCKLQCVLDHLEGLVVARIFELSKMNRAGTGYKLCKHIGKALQARSAAIHTVVKYAFLSDFDLLRDAHQDVSQHPWATPTGRLTMDTYFKMRRAQEEIQHLNVEIRRVATYLRDENKHLLRCENQLKPLHPALAHQVGLHRKEISMLEGFTGSITPGTSIEQGPGSSTSIPTVCIPSILTRNGLSMPQEGADDLEEDLKEEEDTEVDSEEHARILEDILQVTSDI
ncbi:uncharacterized protein EDB93DRAFT_1273720 [Suillus bovinus]|uniref:uncharacterized protein n=1 Tax=Suillus bovinus TaxID=48563 RepID=UPI001B88323B|nr:uncharacterized protein EDB93DRAFT_1273720 [Suillus bovinus]KAG2126569.1 hypothetical protein EDB93DRAFT_1273720 [Suillus bovinus]